MVEADRETEQYNQCRYLRYRPINVKSMYLLTYLYRPTPVSLTEREDHRLHHGKEHANLPDHYAQLDPCYSIGKERAPNIYASFHDCLGSYGT